MRMALSILCFALVVLPWPKRAAGQTASDLVGRQFDYTARPGDTLTSLSARFGASLEVLLRLNGVPSNHKLSVGERVQVDSRHIAPPAGNGIVINIPQRMLFLLSEGRVVRAYPVSLGRPDWPTVVGTFTIARKEVDPTWNVPPSIQEEMRRQGKPVLTCVPPGPENPLGKYYMALSAPNFGIHGTNAPSSIFRFQTHGCIRVHPDDIEDLFPRVMIGTSVEITYVDILLTELDGALLIEVHRDVYRRLGNPMERVREMITAQGWGARVNWKEVEQAVRRAEGLPTVIGH